MCVVVNLLFAPAEHSRLVQQSELLRLSLIILFPLGDGVLSGSVGMPTPHKAVLQNSCLMSE